MVPFCLGFVCSLENGFTEIEEFGAAFLNLRRASERPRALAQRMPNIRHKSKLGSNATPGLIEVAFRLS